MKKYLRELVIGVGIATIAFVAMTFPSYVFPFVLLFTLLFGATVLVDKNKEIGRAHV
jgi:hypothetical protein